MKYDGHKYMPVNQVIEPLSKHSFPDNELKQKYFYRFTYHVLWPMRQDIILGTIRRGQLWTTRQAIDDRRGGNGFVLHRYANSEETRTKWMNEKLNPYKSIILLLISCHCTRMVLAIATCHLHWTRLHGNSIIKNYLSHANRLKVWAYWLALKFSASMIALGAGFKNGQRR